LPSSRDFVLGLPSGQVVDAQLCVIFLFFGVIGEREAIQNKHGFYQISLDSGMLFESRRSTGS